MNRCEYNYVVLLILSPKILQDSRAFSSVFLEMLDDVDLLEMLSISGNVEKMLCCFKSISGKNSVDDSFEELCSWWCSFLQL